MNSTLNVALDDLNATLDQCFADWTEGARTADPTRLAAYASELFTGTGGHTGQDKADSYSYADSIDALPRLLGYVKGSTHTVDQRYVRMRSAEEGVASFEQTFEREGKVLLRFLYLQTWRKIDGKWLLVREMLEQMAGC